MDELLDCEHSESIATRRKKSNGTEVVTIQCLNCGGSLGEKPKRLYQIDTLPEWSQDLQDRYIEERRAAWKERAEHQRIAADLQRLQERMEHKEGYHDYLQSPHWHQLRRRVIVRDNFHCQNCFCHVTDYTAQVHHTSYDGYQRLGKSFAFECVTLCAQCHKDFHGIEEVSYELQNSYQ